MRCKYRLRVGRIYQLKFEGVNGLMYYGGIVDIQAHLESGQFSMPSSAGGHTSDHNLLHRKIKMVCDYKLVCDPADFAPYFTLIIRILRDSKFRFG